MQRKSGASASKATSSSTAHQISNAAIELHRRGRLADAESSYRQALKQDPNQIDALRNLGVLLMQTGRAADAVALLANAIQKRPGRVSLYEALADFYLQVGASERAIALLHEGLRVAPESPALFYRIGMAHNYSRRPELALEQFDRAVQLAPDSGEYRYRLASALRENGLFNEAVACYEAAERLSPDNVDILVDLAGTLRLCGHEERAMAVGQRAIELHPDHALALNNHGNALLDAGRYDEATRHLGAAVAHAPTVALGNLGCAYVELGRIEEGIAALRRAAALQPNDQTVRSSIAFALPFAEDLDPLTILQQTRGCCQPIERVARSSHAGSPDRRTNRRVRVGYVSPDWREHCQSLFTLPLFANHDRAAFEVFCYSSVLHSDQITERLRACADHWREVCLLDDLALARVIEADRIDILVDLTMHMARNRLGTFALRPAPVQVTYLAYPGTTGTSFIDYRFTDPYLDPDGTDFSCYTEQSYRLPRTFWCYDPLTEEPVPGPLPALAAGAVTFGCLNAFRKFNAIVAQLFSRVLLRSRGSRLVMLCPCGASRQRVRALFEQLGVAAERLLFVDRLPRRRYLETYRGIDICLDTAPYNGHTTSLDAWWMGVPVVSILGQTIVGRAGLSQAMNLGLPELVAESVDEFVQIASDLAQDTERLVGLRDSLRERMRCSPLMDAPAFARAIEAGYRAFWSDYCDGNAPTLRGSAVPRAQ